MKPVLWFLQSVGLDVQTPADRPDVHQMLVYINATAQEYLAIGLIERFKQDPAAPSDHKPQ